MFLLKKMERKTKIVIAFLLLLILILFFTSTRSFFDVDSQLLKIFGNKLKKSENKSLEDIKLDIEAKQKKQKEQLGRATWRLLHVMGLKYPPDASKKYKEDLKTFLHLLSGLYPCSECAEHFRAKLKRMPPDVSNKEKYNEWLCNLHNDVNKDLKKPQFDCNDLKDKWGCGCEA